MLRITRGDALDHDANGLRRAGRAASCDRHGTVHWASAGHVRYQGHQRKDLPLLPVLRAGRDDQASLRRPAESRARCTHASVRARACKRPPRPREGRRVGRHAACRRCCGDGCSLGARPRRARGVGRISPRRSPRRNTRLRSSRKRSRGPLANRRANRRHRHRSNTCPRDCRPRSASRRSEGDRESWNGLSSGAGVLTEGSFDLVQGAWARPACRPRDTGAERLDEAGHRSTTQRGSGTGSLSRIPSGYVATCSARRRRRHLGSGAVPSSLRCPQASCRSRSSARISGQSHQGRRSSCTRSRRARRAPAGRRRGGVARCSVPRRAMGPRSRARAHPSRTSSPRGLSHRRAVTLGVCCRSLTASAPIARLAP